MVNKMKLIDTYYDDKNNEQFFLVDMEYDTKTQLERIINTERLDLQYFEKKTLSKNISDDFDLILVNLYQVIPEQTIYCFNDAEKIIEPNNYIYEYNKFKHIKIRFTNTTSYVSLDDAIELLQNHFLRILSNELKYTFFSQLILYIEEDEHCRFPYGIFHKQINYTALIFFIQNDFEKITIKELNNLKNNKYMVNLRFNPFFTNKTEVINSIDKVYKTINKVGKENTLLKLFCLHYINKYLLKNKKTYHLHITELNKRGFTYDSSDDIENTYNNSANSSQYVKQVKLDIKKIKKIQDLSHLHSDITISAAKEELIF